MTFGDFESLLFLFLEEINSCNASTIFVVTPIAVVVVVAIFASL